MFIGSLFSVRFEILTCSLCLALQRNQRKQEKSQHEMFVHRQSKVSSRHSGFIHHSKLVTIYFTKTKELREREWRSEFLTFCTRWLIKDKFIHSGWKRQWALRCWMKRVSRMLPWVQKLFQSDLTQSNFFLVCVQNKRHCLTFVVIFLLKAKLNVTLQPEKGLP